MEPCSGRTQLLHFITAQSVLPKSLNKLPLPGKQGASVYIDTDNQFSILRLHSILSQIITSHIIKAGPVTSPDDKDVRSVILSSLDHVHVFRPASSQALVAVLEKIPEYFLNTDAHKSSARSLRTVIISNISAFIWSDRHGPATDFSTEATPTFLHQRSAQLAASLRNVQERFTCIIIAGAWAFASPKATQFGGKELRPYFPSPWNNLCVVRVVIQRERVRKFEPGLSVEEALTEGPKRWEAVQKADWSGWLNWWGWEHWDRRALEETMGSTHEGAFNIKIDKSGLHFLATSSDGNSSSKILRNPPSQYLR